MHNFQPPLLCLCPVISNKTYKMICNPFDLYTLLCYGQKSVYQSENMANYILARDCSTASQLVELVDYKSYPKERNLFLRYHLGPGHLGLFCEFCPRGQNQNQSESVLFTHFVNKPTQRNSKNISTLFAGSQIGPTSVT